MLIRCSRGFHEANVTESILIFCDQQKRAFGLFGSLKKKTPTAVGVLNNKEGYLLQFLYRVFHASLEFLGEGGIA
jgi:hypothetical protein